MLLLDGSSAGWVSRVVDRLMGEGAPSSTSARGPWLVHPLVDVLIGCGLCSLPLILVADAAGTTSVVLVLAAGLSLLVNGPHYAATIVRAWGLPGHQRTRLLVASVAAVVVAVVAHIWPQLLPWLFTAYLSGSPWHYATQNHGTGLVLLARDGNPTDAAATRGERQTLKLVHALMAVSAVVATHVGPSEPLLRRAGIPAAAAGAVAVGAIVVSLLLTLGVLRRLRKRGAKARGLLLVAALVSTSLLWLAVPALLSRGASVVYAAGVVALLHCAQYLWITNFVQARTAFVCKRPFDGVAWGGLLVALGVCLFSLGPWVLSRAGGYDLMISLLILQSVVNLHHFVVDASIWKLRDPRLQEILRGHERAPAKRERISNARALAFTLPAALLFLLGVVDVVQVAATRADAPARLRELALLQNPNDSRLWLRLAQQAISHGDVDAARADLARAVELSPFNADAQRALARLHVVSGRDDEAWSRFLVMPPSLGDEAETLLLFAGVAERLGKLGEAESLARRALEGVNGGLPLVEIDARTILGRALLQQGQPAKARRELQEALNHASSLCLADAAQADDCDLLRNGQRLELGLAIADANVALGQTDPALVLLERALQGAKSGNRPETAFRALTTRAQILSGREDHLGALQTFQTALRFANDVDDPVRVSRAWLDYADLLARSDAPVRLRYACALQARRDAELVGEPVSLLRATAASSALEEALAPADAESVRADVAAAVADALRLSYPDPAPFSQP